MTPSRLRRLRRRRVIGNLSLLLSGVLVAPFVLLAQKSVVLVVEGEQRTVITYSDDVGEMLAATDLRVPGDAVIDPSPATPLEDGDVIVVDLFLLPGAPGTLERIAETGTQVSQMMDVIDERERMERVREIRTKRQRRVEIARAKRIAERKAAEEAARRAAEEAARKAAEEAARKAAEANPQTKITGCEFDWKTVQGVKDTIACAVKRWPVPGGLAKALAVAQCEHGFQWYSPPGDPYVGVYQHAAAYWPNRAAAYGFAGYDARNGRANVMVAIQYAHEHGWGAWSCP